MTVGQPGPGASTLPWAQLSPRRAAGLFMIMTVALPLTIVFGGPTHVTMSPITAAGSPPMSTVGAPGPITGPPTWGTTPVTSGHTVMSVNRNAGGMGSGYDGAPCPFVQSHGGPASTTSRDCSSGS